MTIAKSANYRMWDRPVVVEALVVTGWALLGCVVYFILSVLIAGVHPTQLEFVATVASVSCGWLVRKQNIWNWPIATVSVVCSGIFFWQINLLGQAGLQLLFYFPIQFWCWWAWIDHSTFWRPQKYVLAMTPTMWGVAAVLYVALTFATAQLISTYNGTLAVWDGSIVAASLIAQYLLATKRAGNWLIWIVPVNIAAIGLYAATGAYMFAALYLFYLYNAVLGYRDWLYELKVVRGFK